MGKLVAAVILALTLAGAAFAQTPGACVGSDGVTTYDVLRWRDDGTARGIYERQPCAPPPTEIPAPTPLPVPEYPTRSVLTWVTR